MIWPDAVQSARAWMFETALPFWCDAGLDRVRGGAQESLSPDARGPGASTFKRSRVAARQIYVFSHAELLGAPGAAAAADHVYAHFVERFWTGWDTGWARKLGANGEILEAGLDLYDSAFALFALGWRYKARKDADCLRFAHRTLDLVEAGLRLPEGLGYYARLPAERLREQNPHMHLIEAALVLAESSGEDRFRALSDEIADLFLTRVCQLPEGILPEFFEFGWQPSSAPGSDWVEPGHQFEWAWILARQQALTGHDHAAAITALVGWAERHGVDPASHSTFDRVARNGRPLDRGSRTWPNTERIKGWIGLAETTGADPRPAIAESLGLLMERHLGQAPRGGWIDRFDADGRPVAGDIPGSTLYHVFLAFSEILRWQAEGA